jgi:hypothetical protein
MSSRDDDPHRWTTLEIVAALRVVVPGICDGVQIILEVPR